MKQVLIRRGRVVVEEMPAPVCGENDVLVRTAYSLISPGTEGASLEASAPSGSVSRWTHRFKKVGEVGASINDLNNLLKLPHMRGRFGEESLERLLADFLPAHMFDMQAAAGQGRERADAVIHFPDRDLPIDSKFPQKAYEMLQVQNLYSKHAYYHCYPHLYCQELEELFVDENGPNAETATWTNANGIWQGMKKIKDWYISGRIKWIQVG